jgi:hypothetical protein
MSKNLLEVFKSITFDEKGEQSITGNYNSRVLLVDGL